MERGPGLQGYWHQTGYWEVCVAVVDAVAAAVDAHWKVVRIRCYHQ